MAATEPDSPVRPRVVICNISRDSIRTRTAVGFIQAATSGVAVSLVFAEAGPYLDSGRNKVLANACEISVEWDWALFIDSDIEFTPEHIDTLLAHTLHPEFHAPFYPVIGGVYINPFDDGEVEGETPDPHGHSGQFGPVCYEWAERDDLMGELNGIPTYTFQRISRKTLAELPPVDAAWNPPGTPSPIAEVACIGTGFMAIHRSLLDEMAETYGQPLPWFEEPVRGGIHYGEDMGFCLRVRDMGYPVLVNRACSVIHHKTIKLL